MSSPLAIAAVTAILKDLLNEGLVNNDLSPVGSFTVTALPPDRITIGDTEESRLNLFLYQVTPNLGWRNADFPSRDGQGMRLSNPPLALDLHYMLTAYGASDLTAEILLGYAMDLLHDTPVLSREVVKRSLSPNNPFPVNLIPPDSQGRLAIDLADQIEVLKITPTYLSADELSKLWTAMQARYRPTVAYQVSTVLIQGTKPVRRPLPVLRRGDKDQGVNASPSIVPPPPSWPTISSIAIKPGDGEQPRTSAELGDELLISGSALDGGAITAEFAHRLLDDPLELPTAVGDKGAILVSLPAAGDAAAANWPAGSYAVNLRIKRPGKPDERTNAVPLLLAPRLKPAPTIASAGGQSTLTIKVAPPIWPAQRVDLMVGSAPVKIAVAAKSASFDVAVLLEASDVPLPVRLRVDGADNILVRDTKALPLSFDPQQVLEPA